MVAECTGDPGILTLPQLAGRDLGKERVIPYTQCGALRRLALLCVEQKLLFLTIRGLR